MCRAASSACCSICSLRLVPIFWMMFHTPWALILCPVVSLISFAAPRYVVSHTALAAIPHRSFDICPIQSIPRSSSSRYTHPPVSGAALSLYTFRLNSISPSFVLIQLFRFPLHRYRFLSRPSRNSSSRASRTATTSLRPNSIAVRNAVFTNSPNVAISLLSISTSTVIVVSSTSLSYGVRKLILLQGGAGGQLRPPGFSILPIFKSN